VLVFCAGRVQQPGHPTKQGLEIKGLEIRLPRLSRGNGVVAYERTKTNLRFEAAELTLNPCCKVPMFLLLLFKTVLCDD
jgi:hypothetical protein